MGFAADINVKSNVQTNSTTTNTDNRSNDYSTADNSQRVDNSDHSNKQSYLDASNRSQTQSSIDVSDHSSRHLQLDQSDQSSRHSRSDNSDHSRFQSHLDASNRSQSQRTIDASDSSSRHLQLDRSDQSTRHIRSDNSNHSRLQSYLDTSDRSRYQLSHDNSDQSTRVSAVDTSNRAVHHSNTDYTKRSSKNSVVSDSNNRFGQSRNNAQYDITLTGSGSSKNILVFCRGARNDSFEPIANSNSCNDKLQRCMIEMMEVATVEELARGPQSITVQITAKSDNLQLLTQMDKYLKMANNVQRLEMQRQDIGALEDELESYRLHNERLQLERRRLEDLNFDLLTEKENLQHRVNELNATCKRLLQKASEATTNEYSNEYVLSLKKELDDTLGHYKKEVFENSKLKVQVQRLETANECLKSANDRLKNDS